MQRTFLDFETYWADDYTLKKMAPVEYIQDPRFEALGCAFINEGGTTEWVDGPDLPHYFAKRDWSDTFAISHNALFDMLILAFRYGVRPVFFGDTLAMARNWLSHSLRSISLASVSAYYGLPEKMETVNKLKNYNFYDLQRNPQLHEECKTYALDDAEKCRTIFARMLIDGFPPRELRIIDWVTRMAAYPQFELDQVVLAEHLANIQRKKRELLDAAGLAEPSSIMSDPQLAAKLLFLGVDVPTKISKTTGNDAFAFAKTDKAFQALLEHPEPMVQALVAARLGHKSTLEESRTERLSTIGRCAPSLPVPLKYSGAHTHRFSGDWKINLQNLPKGGELRRALRAPKGRVVVSVDASQIEARINATLSGQWDLVETFRQGRDAYAEFAEEIYHYPIDKVRQKRERFVGKTGILSLGYGSSDVVFQNMCRIQGDVHLELHEATSIVFLYRQRMKQIVKNWYHANNVVLPMVANGGRHEWGPLVTEKYAIRLPNGNRIRYGDLRHELVDSKYQWQYMRGPLPQRIYGAKVCENVVQALAFLAIAEAELRIEDITQGQLWAAHQVHDELIFIVDEKLAEQVRDLAIIEMSKSPEWMPDAPLAAEGHIGYTYYDAK